MTAISANWPYAASRPTPLRSVLSWMQRQNTLRRTRHILQTLSDRELRDIGIDRGAIDGAAAEAIDRAGGIR